MIETIKLSHRIQKLKRMKTKLKRLHREFISYSQQVKKLDNEISHAVKGLIND